MAGPKRSTGAEFDAGIVHLQGIGRRFRGFHGQRPRLEVGYTHADGNQAVVAHPRPHLSGRALQRQLSAEFRMPRIHQSRYATRAVAALFDLRAVRIEYPVVDPALPIAGRLEHQCLIETDAGMSIRERAEAICAGSSRRGRIEYQEVVAETLHLQKLEAHGRRA
jgi:hypothetical protein